MKIASPINRRFTVFEPSQEAALPADVRREITLFLTITAALCGLSLFGGFFLTLGSGRLTLAAGVLMAVAAILLVAFVLGRSLRHMLAISLVSATVNLAPFIYMALWMWVAPQDHFDTSLVMGVEAWLAPALILAGILLPLKRLLALGGLVTILAAVFPVYLTGGKIPPGIGGFLLTSVILSLIVIARIHALRLEQIRTEELTQARDRLEERVRERTEHLEQINEELQKARRAMQAAFQSRSEYLAEISHDLRAPLTIILGYSEMLAYQAQSQDNPQLLRQLRSLESSARYLTSLSQNMIDLAALERGEMQLNIQPVSLQELFDELCLMAQPLAARNRNTFESRLAGGPEQIKTDPLRLRQALVNVLDNAAKFTQEGVVRFELAAAPAAHDTGAPGVAFTVADTGIGIAPAQIKALFQPFPPSHHATRERFSGAGLGLAITRLLCDRLGGRIEVQSRSGQGSTFTVWMPVDGEK